MLRSGFRSMFGDFIKLKVNILLHVMYQIRNIAVNPVLPRPFDYLYKVSENKRLCQAH